MIGILITNAKGRILIFVDFGVKLQNEITFIIDFTFTQISLEDM